MRKSANFVHILKGRHVRDSIAEGLSVDTNKQQIHVINESKTVPKTLLNTLERFKFDVD